MKKILFFFCIFLIFYQNKSFSQTDSTGINDNEKKYLLEKFGVKPEKYMAITSGEIFSCGIRSEIWANHVINYLKNNVKNKVIGFNEYLDKKDHHSSEYKEDDYRAEQLSIKETQDNLSDLFNKGRLLVTSKEDCSSDLFLEANILDVKSSYRPLP